MFRFMSLEKRIRLTCMYSSRVRIKPAKYDVIIRGHVFKCLMVAECHVNRGISSLDKIVAIKCDNDSLDIDEHLQKTIKQGECQIVLLNNTTNQSTKIDVSVYSTEVRVVVSSNDERISPQQCCLLVVNGKNVCRLEAYEPNTTAETREVILSQSNAQIEQLILSSLALGAECGLVMEADTK